MQRVAVLFLALALGACATPSAVPDAPPAGRFFDDRLFAAPSMRVRAEDVFALSDEMRRYAAREIAELARVKGRQIALIDALHDAGALRLEYDTESTRNAAEAFAARSGNCLSLVIMTAAFAKELGLLVDYQKVFVDDSFARIGNVYLSIGHVNLTLGRRTIDTFSVGHRVGNRAHESLSTTVDFLPPGDLRSMRSRPIREEIVVAMFMNNRAVEALARGRVDDAYWWAREAIVQAPEFVAAYNTLGAIYLRHGNPGEAERALAHVLRAEPENTQAMSNQVAALAALGRTEDAQRLAAHRDRLQPAPPFHHFNRGLAALQSGDSRAARDEFAREVARDPYYHEFQFWLGITYLNTGDYALARKHLALALETSTTQRDRDLYASKLDRIRALH